jgi:hypothetical protein
MTQMKPFQQVMMSVYQRQITMEMTRKTNKLRLLKTTKVRHMRHYKILNRISRNDYYHYYSLEARIRAVHPSDL